MLKVSCPRCKKVQNYQPKDNRIVGKIKVCVYCGCSFKVHTSPENTRIVDKKK